MRIGTVRMPRLRPSKEWHIRKDLRRSAAKLRGRLSATEPASDESTDSLKMRASSLCVGWTSIGQVNTAVRPLCSSLAVILGGREYRIKKIVYRIACIQTTAYRTAWGRMITSPTLLRQIAAGARTNPRYLRRAPAFRLR